MEVDQLQSDASDLQATVERLKAQILALSDEQDKLLNERRKGFKEKFDSRFKGVDVKAALIGATARWPLTFVGATYFFELPKGSVASDVDAFMRSPSSTEKDVVTDWGRIEPEESILLKMLTGVQHPGQQETSFKGRPVYQRLRVLREMPQALIRALADRAATFESYLNCCLELELGS